MTQKDAARAAAEDAPQRIQKNGGRGVLHYTHATGRHSIASTAPDEIPCYHRDAISWPARGTLEYPTDSMGLWPVQLPQMTPRTAASRLPRASRAQPATAKDQFNSHRWRRGPLHLGPPSWSARLKQERHREWRVRKRMARTNGEGQAMFCARPRVGMPTPFGTCVEPAGATRAKPPGANGQFNPHR